VSTVKRDISMSIIADTRRYQAEMAKIPGMTDKAAAKAAERMVKQEQKRISTEEKLRKKAAKDQETLAKDTASKTAAAMKGAATAIAAGFTAAAAAGVGLITLGQDIADTRNELTDLSVETGISADTLAALRFGAQATGKELGDVAGAMAAFSQRMVAANRDGGTLAMIFDGLNIELENVDGTMRGTDEVFRETIKTLSSVESKTLRNAAAADLFGDAGGKLINITKTLGGDLDLYADAVDTVGLSMDEGAQESEDFQRAMATLGLIMDGIKGTVGPLALAFSKGLAASLMLTKVTAMLAHSGLVGYAAVFLKIKDGIEKGAIPSLKELETTMRESVEHSNKAIKKEVDAFRVLIGAVKTTGDEVGNLEGLLEQLSRSKNKDAKATAAASSAEKTAADVAKQLTKARRDALDPQVRLVQAFTQERRQLLGLVDAGADAAQVQELIALKSAAMEKQFQKAGVELEKKRLEEMAKAGEVAQKVSDELTQAKIDQLEPTARLTAEHEREVAALEATIAKGADAAQVAELQAIKAAELQKAISNIEFEEYQKKQDETKEKNKELAVSFANLIDNMGQNLGIAAGFAELALDDYSNKATKAASRSDKLRSKIKDLRKSMTDASKEERAEIASTIEDKEDELEQAEKRKKRQSKLARQAFREVKALRIAETTISGAAAAIRAVAELGFIGGAGLIAAGGIAATTALNIATIKRQKAPKFHQGGMVEPDETPAILRRGEAVLSERATQRLGRQTIERLNRDEPLGAVNIYLGDDLLRSQRLTRAPRGGTHTAVGARSPYLGR